MIDLNKQYETVDGHQVKLFEVLDDKIFGAYLSNRCGKWIQGRWWRRGESTTGEPKLGLVEKKRQVSVEVWVNVYPGTGTQCHNTRQSADNSAAINRIACKKVVVTTEVDDGEGL